MEPASTPVEEEEEEPPAMVCVGLALRETALSFGANWAKQYFGARAENALIEGTVTRVSGDVVHVAWKFPDDEEPIEFEMKPERAFLLAELAREARIVAAKGSRSASTILAMYGASALAPKAWDGPRPRLRPRADTWAALRRPPGTTRSLCSTSRRRKAAASSAEAGDPVSKPVTRAPKTGERGTAVSGIAEETSRASRVF